MSRRIPRSVLFVSLAILAAMLAPGSANAQTSFTDVSDAAGLTKLRSAIFNNCINFGDYNGDGWVDLYMGNRSWSTGETYAFLFTNDGDGTFTQTNSLTLNQYAMWTDYNGDGLLDLVSAWGGMAFWKNNGDGTFTQETGLLSHVPTNYTEGAAFVDVDKDGDLDFYHAGYELLEQRDGSWYWEKHKDSRWRNDGGSGFTRVWLESGDIMTTRGMAPADFDQDNDVDLFLSHYRLFPNWLWVNDGAGNLTERAADYNLRGDNTNGSDPNAWGHTIASAWGDLDNDGDLDLFVGNFAHSDASQDRTMVMENRNGTFVDRSADAGIPYQESWSTPALGDFDNDGDLDVFYTTVYTGDSARMFRNDGNFNFTEVTSAAGLSGRNDNANYMAAWADYDNDGDLDLSTAGRLYRNDLSNGNHWLKVRVVGDGQTVDTLGVGTQVSIDDGGTTFLRQVEGVTGHANQNDPVLHFGLGNTAGPVDVEVRWMDGSISLVNTAVDTTITVVQDPDGDVDGDGMPNQYEAEVRGNIVLPDGDADPDGDGLTNVGEYQAGTDPFDADSDGDTLSDGAEVTAGTNPLNPDTDGDGADDALELYAGSDPNDPNDVPVVPLATAALAGGALLLVGASVYGMRRRTGMRR